jgi:transposase
MAKKYRVSLTVAERQALEQLITRGKGDARCLAHARILLQTDESPAGPAHDDVTTAESLTVSVRTIERVRQRFVEEGFELALKPRPTKRVYQRLLDGRQEARLIKLACSTPPEGKGRWTLRLLADQMVALNHVETLSHETVRRTLKKTNSSRT